jgi:hypothetical protein
VSIRRYGVSTRPLSESNKGFFFFFRFFFFFFSKGKKSGWLHVKTSGGHELSLPSNVCQALRRASATKECVDVARHLTVKKGDIVEVFHTADEDLGLVDALTSATHAVVTVPLANLKFLDDDHANTMTNSGTAERARKHRTHADGANKSSSELTGSGSALASSGAAAAAPGVAASETSGSKVARRKKRSDTAGAEDMPAPALGSVPLSGSTSALDVPDEKKRRHKKTTESADVKLCDQCHTQRAAAMVSFEGEQRMLCKQCTVLDVARRQKSGDATEVVVVNHGNKHPAPVSGQCELCHSAAAVTKTAGGKAVCADCGAVEAETDAAMAAVDAAVGAPAAGANVKRRDSKKSKGSAAAKAAGDAAPKRACKQCGNPKVAARVKIDGVVELLCKDCTVKRQMQYGASPADAAAATVVKSAPATPAAAGKQPTAAAHGSAPTTPAASGATGAAAATAEPDDAAMVADDAAMAAEAANPDWSAMESLFQKRTKFGRKVPLREVLVWSKKPIDKPLIKLPKLHEKKGEQVCAWVHEYISFDASGGADDKAALTAAQQALALPIRTGELRDEVYALLVRYVTHCEDRNQLWRAWQLFAMAAAIFPSSATMHNWLLGVVCHWRPTLGSLDDRRALRKYRRWVVEQLKLLGETRSVSARTPPLDELKFYETAPLGPPSLFGCSLARALEIQHEFYPQFGTKLPLVLTVCTKLIVDLDGPKAQGIFRLPGNTDNIKALQLQVNKGDFALASRPDITVHDIASLLKLWLRGLSEPLIPDSYYSKCIENPDSAKNAMDVFNALPEINKSLVARLLNFLQMIAYPENQEVNKMSLSNLSVVFAPCLLRYPMSTDTLTIMANTVKEQSFVLTLLGLPILNVVDDAAGGKSDAAAAGNGASAAPATEGATVSAGSGAQHKVRRMMSARPPSSREAPASTTAASQTDDAIGRTPANASPLISRLQSRIGERSGRGSRSASVGSAADAAMLGVQLPMSALVDSSSATPAPTDTPPALPPTTAAVTPTTTPEHTKRGKSAKRNELDEKADKADKASGDAVSSAKKKTTSLGKVAAQDAAAAAQARSDRSLKKKAAAEAAEAAQARAAGALKKKLAESKEAEAGGTARRSSKSSLKRSEDPSAITKSPEKVSLRRSHSKMTDDAAAPTEAGAVVAPLLPSDESSVSSVSSVSSSDGVELKKGSTIDSKRRDSSGSGSKLSSRKSNRTLAARTEDALPPPLPATDERPPQTPRPELPPSHDEPAPVVADAEAPATPVAAAVAAVKSPSEFGTPQAPPMFADDDDDDDDKSSADDSDASTSSAALPAPADEPPAAVVAAPTPVVEHVDEPSSEHVAAPPVVVTVTPVVAVEPVEVLPPPSRHADDVDDESSSAISIGDHDEEDGAVHAQPESIVLVEVEPVSDSDDDSDLFSGGSGEGDDDDGDDDDDEDFVEFAQPVVLRSSGLVGHHNDAVIKADHHDDVDDEDDHDDDDDDDDDDDNASDSPLPPPSN